MHNKSVHKEELCCDQCGKICETKPDLNMHNKSVHKEESCCDQCGKICETIPSLTHP